MGDFSLLGITVEEPGEPVEGARAIEGMEKLIYIQIRKQGWQRLGYCYWSKRWDLVLGVSYCFPSHRWTLVPQSRRLP